MTGCGCACASGGFCGGCGHAGCGGRGGRHRAERDAERDTRASWLTATPQPDATVTRLPTPSVHEPSDADPRAEALTLRYAPTTLPAIRQQVDLWLARDRDQEGDYHRGHRTALYEVATMLDTAIRRLGGTT